MMTTINSFYFVFGNVQNCALNLNLWSYNDICMLINFIHNYTCVFHISYLRYFKSNRIRFMPMHNSW